ncbi:MAG: LD-carboxypeptidase [Betaproteobacteria bacterium]|nr:LD-carboxypeptidase [Betaproteobacteria bacterium]
MSSIYVYSPSGAVRDRVAFKRGLQRLKTLGHTVVVDEGALRSHQRFAGSDAERVQAIERACASQADVALISRGGYGLTRILPALNYPQIAKAIDRGTRFMGLSDFTAFQSAVLAKTGAHTWAGPALGEDLGAEALDDIMLACFDDVLQGQGEGVGWRLSSATQKFYSRRKAGTWARDGVLWGGNLAVLVSLLGTPYFPQIDRGVLFLEDIAEHPYRIERMLTQLLHAGVLARQQAIVLGQFTQFQLTAHDKGFKLASVVAWLRSNLKVPVLTDLPFGHVPTKVCLPVGAPVSVLVEERDALILWPHGH